jgi:uncharacterized protein YbaR (Trm112 family)
MAVTTPEPINTLIARGGLVDPATLESLKLSDDGEWLEAPSGRRHPIRDGIPTLLKDTEQAPTQAEGA